MHGFLAIVLLIMATSSVTYTSATASTNCFILTQWRIYIINDISEEITFHVKSKDDDLGNHTRPFHGLYDWSFCVTWGTLFNGEFWWGSKYQTLHLYDSDIDFKCSDKWKVQTQNCYWLVRPEGLFWGKQNLPFPNDVWHLAKPWA